MTALMSRMKCRIFCHTRSIWCSFLIVGCGFGFVMQSHGQVLSHSQREETGSIKGHVYCGDVNLPARLADVTIQSASSLIKEPNQSTSRSVPESDLPISIRADLDGVFTIGEVKPGRYVIVAWLPGYLSPLALLAAETDQFGGPSKGFKLGLEKLVPSVVVEANQTSSVDIRLERGAEISGTVSYDDGGPVIGSEVELLQQVKEGEWRVVPLGNSLVAFENGSTDDRGRFRLVGIPPGKYIVSAALPLETFWGAGIVRGSVRYAMPRTLTGKLAVYSGDTLRESHAKLIEIASGESRPGTDITIPLSKLHHIAGMLTAARDEHPLKAGLIELLYSNDMSVAQRTHLDEDGTFLINFVTNGDYVLRVTGGPLDDESNAATPSSSEASAARGQRNPTYKGIEIHLRVHGDLDNLAIALNE